MATESDKPNTGMTATLLVIGAIMTLAAALFLTGMVRAAVRERSLEIGGYADLNTVRGLKDGQKQALEAAPAWLNKGDGIVSVPIDTAMDLVVRDVSKNPAFATPQPPKKDDEEGADAGAPTSTEEGAEGAATEGAPPSEGEKKEGSDAPKGDEGAKKESGAGGAQGAAAPSPTDAPKKAPEAAPEKPEGVTPASAPN
jgi:hypothetical protein